MRGGRVGHTVPVSAVSRGRKVSKAGNLPRHVSRQRWQARRTYVIGVRVRVTSWTRGIRFPDGRVRDLDPPSGLAYSLTVPDGPCPTTAPRPTVSIER